MNVPLVDEAIGGSLAAFSRRGDYRRALAVADQALAAALQERSPTAEAEARFARGVVCFLAGEPAAATKELDAVAAQPGLSDVLAFRVGTFRYAAATADGSVFPGELSASSLDTSMRWDEIAEARREGARCGEPAAVELLKREPLLMVENRWVREILVAAPVIRSCSRRGLAVKVDLEKLTQLEVFFDRAQLFCRIFADIPSRSHENTTTALLGADLRQASGRPVEAAALLAEAEAVAETAGDGIGLANCALARGDWLAARSSSVEALNFFLEEGGFGGTAIDWAVEEGECDFHPEDAAAVAGHYDRARRLYTECGARRGLAAVGIRDGYLAFVQQRFDAAADHARQAAHDFDAAGDRSGTWLARVHELVYRVGAGVRSADPSLVREIGEWGQTRGSFSYALGLALLLGRAARHFILRRANIEAAIILHRQCAELSESLGARVFRFRSIVDLAATLSLVGEEAEASALNERALADVMGDGVERLPPAFVTAVIAVALSLHNNYITLRNPEGLKKIAGRLEALVRRLDAADMAGALREESLQTLREGGRTTIANTRVLEPLYAGAQARAEGRFEAAQDWFARALTAANTFEGPERLRWSAFVLGLSGRSDEAAAAYHRFLDEAPVPEKTDRALRIIRESSRGDQHAKRFKQDRLEHAATFFTKIQRWADARRYFNELDALAGERWWMRNDRPWSRACDYGEVAEGLGELEVAIAWFAEGIRLFEDQREQLEQDQLKRALGGGAQSLYLGAARATLGRADELKRSGDTAAARAAIDRSFEFSERGRARALMELMAGGDGGSGDQSRLSAAVRQWRSAHAAVSLWRRLAAAEAAKPSPDAATLAAYQEKAVLAIPALDAATVAVSAGAPAFHAAVSPTVELIGIERLAGILPADVVVISFQTGPNHLLGWAVTRDGIVASTAQSLKERRLERAVLGFVDRCRNRLAVDAGARELGELLLEPFSAVLERSERVVFVPSGVLHDAPLHAVSWKGEPLGVRLPVSSLPSVGASAFLVAPRGPAHSVLAVGNPTGMAWPGDYGREPVAAPELPWSAVEASFVAGLFPQRELLLGADATQEKVLRGLAHARIVHLATHAHLSRDVPLLSSVLLAAGEALTVQELVGVQLDADLVVLSACDSGRGDRSNGDDVLGLSHAILAAGARSAMVSLWPVSDASTCLLMGEFYRQLIGGVPAWRALHRARVYLRGLDAAGQVDALLEMQQQIPSMHASFPGGAASRGVAGVSEASIDAAHPYFWAPFVLVGL